MALTRPVLLKNMAYITFFIACCLFTIVGLGSSSKTILYFLDVLEHKKKKVNHPLIVKKLGILFDLLNPNTDAKVAILDIQNKEIVVQTIISKNASFFENGYLYEDVETILLPKHYEGMVLVEGYLHQDAIADILWNDGGGVITFNRIYSTPSHADSIKYSSKIHPAASIYFVIHEFDDLKYLLSEEERITSEWLLSLDNINRKLLIESNEMQDILFVDVKDTYRNLPNKLLQFYKWINQNHEYSYVMKSDDDTVVDVVQLVNHMKNSSRFRADGRWIWSWRAFYVRVSHQQEIAPAYIIDGWIAGLGSNVGQRNLSAGHAALEVLEFRRRG